MTDYSFKIIETKILQQPPPKNILYFPIGLAVLVLNKIRYFVLGYKSPRPFDISQTQQAIDYDVDVIKHWIMFLSAYTNNNVSIKDKNILELGPGADLGVGLITLHMGAEKYNALDVNNLVANVPDIFYDEFFKKLPINNETNNVTFLKEQLELTKSGKNDRLNYVCRDDFDISVFGENSIDIVFSQAAIEHFDDIEVAFKQLSAVVKPGGILVAEIDLNTHTRWLRDVDPLNIYRYPKWLYKALKFRGAPNRVRPIKYKQTLENNEWENIYIKPLTVIDKQYQLKCRSHLSREFRSESAQIDHLTILLCATKK